MHSVEIYDTLGPKGVVGPLTAKSQKQDGRQGVVRLLAGHGARTFWSSYTTQIQYKYKIQKYDTNTNYKYKIQILTKYTNRNKYSNTKYKNIIQIQKYNTSTEYKYKQNTNTIQIQTKYRSKYNTNANIKIQKQRDFIIRNKIIKLKIGFWVTRIPHPQKETIRQFDVTKVKVYK